MEVVGGWMKTIPAAGFSGLISFPGLDFRDHSHSQGWILGSDAIPAASSHFPPHLGGFPPS